MYSIYDAYGMQNDLENRYSAAKNAGVPMGSQRPSLSNSPFLPNMPQATPLAEPPNMPQAISEQQQSLWGVDNASNYGAPARLGDENYKGGEEAPAWMGKAHDMIMGTAFNIAGNAALPGIGGAVGSLAWNSLKNAADGDFSMKRLTKDAIGAATNIGLGKLDPTGKLIGAVGSKNQLVNAGMSMGAKIGMGQIVPRFLGWLTGTLGLNEPGKHMGNTIGDFEQDPFLAKAVNPYTGLEEGETYKGDYEPFGKWGGNINSASEATGEGFMGPTLGPDDGYSISPADIWGGE